MSNYGWNRTGWDVAGTEEYDKESSFHDRVVRFNKKQASARKRALWANTKANRTLYGVGSEHAQFKLYKNTEQLDKHVKVLAQSAFLPMHVKVTP